VLLVLFHAILDVFGAVPDVSEVPVDPICERAPPWPSHLLMVYFETGWPPSSV